MVPMIGSDVTYQGVKFHVQDTNHLNQTARVGIPDASGLVWDTITVPYDRLQKL